MSPTLAAITLTAVFTLCYLGLCAVSPFGHCRACRGFGFRVRTGPGGRPRRGRDCRRCLGHGFRIRPGRRLLNRLAAVRRDGQS